MEVPLHPLLSMSLILPQRGLSEAMMDTIVELAYETLRRRDMHRKAGRALPPLPDEEAVHKLLSQYRAGRGMREYTLAEHGGTT